MTSRESFENLPEWIKEIDKHADSTRMVKYLVGNCADLMCDSDDEEEKKDRQERKVTRDEALRFMK